MDESRIADLRVPFGNIPELPGATSTHAPTVHVIPAADTITEFKGRDKGKGKNCGKFKDKDNNGKHMGLAGKAAVANTADAPTTLHALTSGTVCTICLARMLRCTCNRTPLATLPRIAAAAPAAAASSSSTTATVTATAAVATTAVVAPPDPAAPATSAAQVAQAAEQGASPLANSANTAQ